MKFFWYKCKSTERNPVRRNETKSVWNLIWHHDFFLIKLTKFDLTTGKVIRQYEIRLAVTKTWFLASIPLHKLYEKSQLTYEVPVLPSYRNQSIDMHSKSIDWFQYEGDTGNYWVNVILIFVLTNGFLKEQLTTRILKHSMLRFVSFRWLQSRRFLVRFLQNIFYEIVVFWRFIH